MNEINIGRICLDVLNLPPKGSWKPSWNISTVLTSIQLLMSEPNPDDGLMAEITQQYKDNQSEFTKIAKSWNPFNLMGVLLNQLKILTTCTDNGKAKPDNYELFPNYHPKKVDTFIKGVVLGTEKYFEY